MLRLAQWDWLRMKVGKGHRSVIILSSYIFQCTTLQYIATLQVCCESLREIIEILSPIRSDSVEGANGLKVNITNNFQLVWNCKGNTSPLIEPINDAFLLRNNFVLLV